MFFSINPTKTLIHGSKIIYYKFYNILLLTNKPMFLLDYRYLPSSVTSNSAPYKYSVNRNLS